MKAVALFFSLCVVVVLSETADDYKAKFQALTDACKKDLKFGDDVAKIMTEKRAAVNENENCFLECVYTKMGIIKDGKINQEGSKKMAIKRYGNDQEKLKKAEELFNKCYGDVNSNTKKEKCHLGKKVRQCFVENESKFNVLN